MAGIWLNIGCVRMPSASSKSQASGTAPVGLGVGPNTVKGTTANFFLGTSRRCLWCCFIALEGEV